MISNTQTPVIEEGAKPLNTNRLMAGAEIRESKMKPTASNVIRWAGLAAMVAGIIYAGIQPIHPADFVASVTTDAWSIITPLKTAMAFLFLLGVTGIYARQVSKAGWLGLVGFLMFSLCWALELAFIFAEAFIMPLLAITEPKFVDGYLGVAAGHASEVDLGAIPVLYGLNTIMYLLGGLLFGIATFRAGILPRWVGALLAATAALTPLAALLPHNIQRLAGMPMGLAVACLGYALWAERRTHTSEPVSGKESAILSQSATE